MAITIIAIDLGPKRSGVAVLGRRHETVRRHRFTVVDIDTRTLFNDEVCALLEELRPRFVLVEKAAEGYDQRAAQRALAEVTAAIDPSTQTLWSAGATTWRKEAFGSARVGKRLQQVYTQHALEKLCDSEEAASIWQSTAGSANRNARSALIMLMCWEPKEMILTRGRWGLPVVMGKHETRKSSTKLVSAGAGRLYEMLWLCGQKGLRPGQALLCKAAYVSTRSYAAYMLELARAELIERSFKYVDGDLVYTQVVL